MGATRLLWLVLAVGAAGCGGSSSESPWPIEPLDAEPGPFGEAPPAGDATDVGVPPNPSGAAPATEPGEREPATPESDEPAPEEPTDDEPAAADPAVDAT
jgi:hypothetical protein